LAGPAGRAAGADLGASLDFQDFRSYFPGDDVRHVDWSVYARSDALVVRLYREEVCPDVEVILDCSRSMASTARKASFAIAGARLFLALAQREHGTASVLLAGDAPHRIGGAHAARHLGPSVFSGAAPLDAVLGSGAAAVKKRAVRAVVSDFLFPHSPATLIARLARGAAALFVVQVLDPSECEPDYAGGRLLVDVETGEAENMLVDARAVAAYRRRLDALTEGLARHCRLWATPFARTVAGSIAAACRGPLLRAGIVEVA
jgi:uncharacterized protein (DUF58 family)